jgi:hypothetical protein
MASSNDRRLPALRALMAAAALLALSVAAARADSCQDLGALKEKRESILQSINVMVQANKGKQLDAETFCGHARPIIAADNAFLAALNKNKDWCQIPDEVLTQFKEIQGKDTAMATRACNVAAQMKKAKEQAEAGAGGMGESQAPKLPAGPL